MTVRMDDAVIRVTVDTTDAKKQVKEMMKAHGDLKTERKEGEKGDKKKKTAQKKEGMLGRMAVGGKARMRAFAHRHGQIGGGVGMGSLGAVAGYAALAIFIQRLVFPAIQGMIQESFGPERDPETGKPREKGYLEKKIMTIVEETIKNLENTVGELTVQVAATATSSMTALDYAKKAALLTGETMDISEVKDYFFGVKAWNEHLLRMQHFGTRKAGEQFGAALMKLAKTGMGGTGPR